MKFLFSIIFIQLIFLFSYDIGRAEPDISANNAVLIEQETGEVLYEKEAFDERSIASITKIMTALLAIESGKLEETVTVSRNAIYTEGSSIYLEQGEKMKLGDLVYGLMLRSGNDAAVAIAEHIGESEEGFVFLMNEKARWLGMNHTQFNNPHGLDHEFHYSSAYDMAILTRAAMQNETYQKISATKDFKSDQRSYSWQNKHRLVTGYYQYATGGKTGFTKRTGRTLVTTAEKDGQTLIAVTLNGPNDWNDHINLFEWGFEESQAKDMLNEVESDVMLPAKKMSRQRRVLSENKDIFSEMTELFREVVGLRLW